MICDMVVEYGAGVLGEVDYETFVGLWLNQGRAQIRRAAAVTMGLGFALQDTQSATWFDAMSNTEEEAKNLADEFSERKAMSLHKPSWQGKSTQPNRSTQSVKNFMTN